jgi:hypothetical protein
VFDVLAAAIPSWLTPKEVAQALGKTTDAGRGAIRRLLTKMFEDGQVQVVGSGQYTVVYQGNSGNTAPIWSGNSLSADTAVTDHLSVTEEESVTYEE